MTKEKLLTLDGKFSWNFLSSWFIETKEGNFIWDDPDYGGDNSIRPYSGSFDDWLENIPLARDKGTHKVKDYCGSDFTFLVPAE